MNDRIIDATTRFRQPEKKEQVFVINLQHPINWHLIGVIIKCLFKRDQLMLTAHYPIESIRQAILFADTHHQD